MPNSSSASGNIEKRELYAIDGQEMSDDVWSSLVYQEARVIDGVMCVLLVGN